MPTEIYKTTLIDEVSPELLYIGKATSGAPPSSPVWQIRRLSTENNNTKIEYADSGNFLCIWDDRDTLSYS